MTLNQNGAANCTIELGVRPPHFLHLVSQCDIWGWWGRARVQRGVAELGVVGSLAGVISVAESTVKPSPSGACQGSEWILVV